MAGEFTQIEWDDALQADLRQLVRLAVAEDLGDQGDLTTNALAPRAGVGGALVVARSSGVIAGLRAAAMVAEAIDLRLAWEAHAQDGQAVLSGDQLGQLKGPVQAILAAERITLNLLGRLSGVATLTRQYADAVRHTKARVYDTRKTTPGWRRIEKYAVRCGGGYNHRMGLYDAILIKDNHLAWGARPMADGYTPAEAVARARSFAAERPGGDSTNATIVEIEVDTLEQLDQVLPAGPDVVLLDNMSPDQLREAVARRDARAVDVELEASGGVTLQTIGAIAESGVERISVGALTHSAVCLDIGLDWSSESEKPHAYDSIRR